ncbi:MAG TPA: hypothetical protein VKP65_07015 [Rhodothermales bacterium]|nr:hypothetical protein [Rhodothermales bacterium]
MQRTPLFFFLGCLLLAVSPVTQTQAQADKQAKIQSAMSAAPSSIADDATIMDWPAEAGGEMGMLREGTNGWTCLPDMPDTPGTDPMCLDKPWLEWADAWMNKKEPNISQMGFGYMLRGGSPESNTDPYAEGPTADNEWLTESVPHLMILVPDEQALAGLPTNPESGGPWVMWRDTPYVHIMAPMPPYKPEK